MSHLSNECQRLMQRMQTVTLAMEQGTVALALPVLLAPLIDSAQQASLLAEESPDATWVQAERDPYHQAVLDGGGIKTDLTVPESWTEKE